ncbi:MAG TPA: M48 family metallopeptidase, partial [Dongiaceae bacterium]|nr:M48 family metallopeptidase [Dongiaceae bacterium]
RLLFIQHPSKPDWKLYTSDRTILDDPHLHSLPSLQTRLKQAKSRHRLNWGIFAAVMVAILALPVGLLLGMDRITGVLARQVPVEWEQQLGDTAFKQFKVNGHFLPDKQAEELLEPLIRPLLDANDDQRFKFRFHISRDDEVNAFALPGGQVVINSGLILKADNASELLGVVAHEMMHVTEQHGMRNIMGTAGIYLTVNAVLGDMSGLLAVVADAAPFLINQTYSRGFESAADRHGVALLHEAQIDPAGLTRFFEKLKQEEEKRLKELAGEDNSELAQAGLSLLSTHPATDDRIQQLQELIAEQPHQRHRDLDEAFLHLQDAVKQYVTQANAEQANSEQSDAEAEDEAE